MDRADFFELKNGEKARLPFTDKEYKHRVLNLRKIMSENNMDMAILTSMHNIAYYTGFIYCSFGRPYGCIITEKKIVTISANIDASQPWRRSNCENIIYTDWKKDNFLRAIVSIIGRDKPPKNIGIEEDHLTLDIMKKVKSIFSFSNFSDIAKDLMKLRMIKSEEELKLARHTGEVGLAMMSAGRETIKAGIPEYEVALAISRAGTKKSSEILEKNYKGTRMSPLIHFLQIMASGKDTLLTHHRASTKIIKHGDPVFLCFCGMNNFHKFKLGFDRIFWVEEIQSDEQIKAFETAVKSQKAALEVLSLIHI